ncbi:MAG: SusC/RagA family TonB-linked outer membrane protein [Bacteroidia bacterium]|nr:SusC/RagA family TonB-linked outer membrane protein [Bacteroidia bacterium]
MSIKLKSVSLLKFLLVMGLTLAFGFVSAQTTVTGVVTSEDGTGLAGATVLIKGTTTGALTDNAGKFQLGSVGSDATLLVSFIGFETAEVAVNGQSNITIAMKPSISQLDEVVVVGYGTVKKKDLTGAVTKVSSKDFNQGVMTAPQQLVQGKVAGVQVVGNSGAPGAETTFRIRGASSVRSGNQPLFVVDGIPLDGRSSKANIGLPGGLNGAPNTNPLTFINPNDIASIEVLKDASATAIYGSRGANGVVIITTKSAQAGAPRIDFQAAAGVSSILRRPEVLDGDQYRQALADYNLSSGDFGGNVDAMGEILRNGINQNYNFSMTGGTERGNYRVSAGYLDQQGIIRKSGLRKYNGAFRGSFNFLKNDRLKLDVNIMATQNNQTSAPVSNNAGFQGSLISQALQWNPTRPLFKEDGSYELTESNSTLNPIAVSDATDLNFSNTRILASIAPTVKIVDGLTYRFQFSVDANQGTSTATIKRFINLQDVENRGWGQLSYQNLTSQQFTHTLNYNADLTSSVSLNAVAGYEYLNYDNKGFGMVAQDFLTDDADFRYIFGNTTQGTRNTFSFADPIFELQSYFARANVNINDKYLVTATVRADGSSKFGENNRYGVFPSFAVAWNIANEDFVPSTINDLKLRIGYGITGNQEFPAGSAQERYGFGQESISLVNVANPDLRWESVSTINVGVDFAFANSRIVGSIDYFTRTTSDLLFQLDAIQPAPATKLWVNLDGNVVNSGVELALNTFIINNDNVQWQLGGNFSYLTNVFNTGSQEVPPIETGEINGQGLSGVRSQRLADGQPLYVFFLRQHEGLTSEGFSQFTDNETLDFSGDPNPDFLLGINTALSVGKVSLSANFQGAFGHQIYNNTANAIFVIGNLGTRNVSTALLEETDLNGNAVQEAQANPIKASTRYLEPGDYLRLANATLSYNIGNIGNSLRNCSVYVTGQNLFIITQYSGFDPEVNTNKAVDGVPSFGIEYVPYPTARNILVGINFGL